MRVPTPLAERAHAPASSTSVLTGALGAALGALALLRAAGLGAAGCGTRDDGSAAVPLLGGHRGANRLARAIAGATGGQAAVTTAGDVRLGLALDDPPPGWRVDNPDAAKDIMAALLAGDPVGLKVEAGDAGWITESGAAFAETAPINVRVTDQAVENPAGDLVLHPTVLALGVGCERGTDADELISLADETLSGAGLATGAVACVVSLDLKADEDAVHALAVHLEHECAHHEGAVEAPFTE